MTKTIVVPVNAMTAWAAETVVQQQLAKDGIKAVGIVATVSPDQRPNERVALYVVATGDILTWDVSVQIERPS